MVIWILKEDSENCFEIEMNLPNTVTAIRLVFLAGFVFAVDQEMQSGVIGTLLLFAWGLDAIDGWLARKFNQVTEFGFLFDKIVDRLVIVVGTSALILYGLIPVASFFVFTKDVVSAFLAAARRGAGGDIKSMGRVGKCMTFLQGTVLFWLLFEGPGQGAAIVLVAVAGLAAGGLYWQNIKKDKVVDN